MKLAQFIQTRMEQLLQDWEDAALEIAPQLKGEGRPAVRDHARSMLEFIYRDLKAFQTRDESVRKALGQLKAPTSSAHAMDRVNQGLSMFQMVEEFRALRARITAAWSDEKQSLGATDIVELVQFNEAIDQLIANSVSSFSALKEQETRLIETLLKASPAPAAIFDPDGKYLFINAAMADLVNMPHQDVIGKTPAELGLELAPGLHNAITVSVSTGEAQLREYYHCFSSGRELYLDYQLVPVCNDQNEVEAIVKTSRDITERKQAEREVWRSANFDLLTGLPNRRLFLDRLEQTLLEADRMGSSFALLFIDLDRFKHANDQLGHKAGDQLLEQVAERMSHKVRAMDTVARLGGDEFTLILKETDKEGAKEAAKAFLASLEEAFEVEGNRVNISGSIGLTVFPQDGKDVEQLMHNADQAMYAAKANGGHQIKVYEPSMAESRSQEIKLSRELHDALRQGQLEVYYQPIIDIRIGSIVGAEALLRWNHPHRGVLTPSAFLGITEQNGLTDSITAFVLGQAVACSVLWRDMSGEAFSISINESPASFVTQSLMDKWQSRLIRSTVEESLVTMELTLDSFNNLQASGFNPVRNLSLQGMGLKLAIDGFGKEPSSLFALQEFRMNSVKLDRELIREAGQGGTADRTLEGLIAMAHATDMHVVAVGVETEQQLQFLTRADCDYAQGFLFSHPMRQRDFEALLKEDRQKRLP